MSKDEARALDELGPLPDGQGQHFVSPMNFTTVGNLIEGNNLKNQGGAPTEGRLLESTLEERMDPPRTENRDRATRSVKARRRLQTAYVSLFRQAATRFVSVEVKRLLRAIAKARKANIPVQDFLNRSEEILEKLPALIAREATPVVASLGNAVLGEVLEEVQADDDESPSATIEAFADEYVAGMGRAHVRESSTQLSALVRDTEDAENVLDVLEERVTQWGERRADKVARRHATQATAALSKIAYVALGITLVRWHAFGDSCEFCNELDGKVVGVEEVFLKSGDKLNGADGGELVTRSNIGHPPAHDGCDCGIAAET